MVEEQSDLNVVYVDDDPGILRIVSMYLKDLNAKVRLFDDPHKCLNALKKEAADIVITDLEMPEIDGLELLKKIKQLAPDTEVIIATGAADKDAAIAALKSGAYDFFEKPVNRDELIASIRRTARYKDVLRERNNYRDQLSKVAEQEARRWGIEALVGDSPEIKKVKADIRLLQKDMKASVLVTGESGTGKELVARAIHSGSKRSSSPFIAVNCSAIPNDLAESMFFGHVKGSFTGAATDKKGFFELADGGTLFLDEISDMALAIQAKLLRVLEDKVVDPVGGTSTRIVDVRIIAATNSDLKKKVVEKKFRDDLFYRLAGFSINVQPLRNRKQDIAMLAHHFNEMLSLEMGRSVHELSDDVVDYLMEYTYPGNVRELKNIIEQALIRSSYGVITLDHIRLNDTFAIERKNAEPKGSRVDDLPLNLKALEKLAIQRALVDADGNVTAAAKLLGIGRSKLYRDLDKI